MMTFRHSLILFSLFVFFFLFPFSVFAQQTYDPSSNHAVRSLPDTNQEQTTLENSVNNTDSGEENQVLGSQSELAQHSVLATMIEALSAAGQFAFLSFITGLLFFGRVGYEVILGLLSLLKYGLVSYANWFSEYVLPNSLESLLLFFLTPAMPIFSSFNDLFFGVNFVLHNVLKSSLDLQVRFVIALLAVGVATLNHRSIKKAYDDLMNTFEKKTGWSVGSLPRDLVWAGSVAILAGAFMFGEVALSSSGSSTQLLHAIGNSASSMITYVIKETKSAFTETEKECKDRKDGCESIVDKGIILAFNYLPGSMPDLGLADAVIRFKNDLFKDENQTTSN